MATQIGDDTTSYDQTTGNTTIVLTPDSITEYTELLFRASCVLEDNHDFEDAIAINALAYLLRADQ